MRFDNIDKNHLSTFTIALGNTCGEDDDEIALGYRGGALYVRLENAVETSCEDGITLVLSDDEVKYMRDYCLYFRANPECDILTQYGFEGDIESACKYLLWVL